MKNICGEKSAEEKLAELENENEKLKTENQKLKSENEEQKSEIEYLNSLTLGNPFQFP